MTLSQVLLAASSKAPKTESHLFQLAAVYNTACIANT